MYMEGAVLGVSVTSEWSVECGGVRYAVCGVQCEYGHPWTLNEHAEWMNEYRYGVARGERARTLPLKVLAAIFDASTQSGASFWQWPHHGA